MTCEDKDGWKYWLNRNIDCSWYEEDTDRCLVYGEYSDFAFDSVSAEEACCICGGGSFVDNMGKLSAFNCEKGSGSSSGEDNNFVGKLTLCYSILFSLIAFMYS